MKFGKALFTEGKFIFESTQLSNLHLKGVSNSHLSFSVINFYDSAKLRFLAVISIQNFSGLSFVIL